MRAEDFGKYHGDSTLYAGLHTWADTPGARGYLEGCVGWDDRVWRNPKSAFNQKDTHSATPTSRDMWLGALVGSSRTLRCPLYWRVLGYLADHDGKLCPDEEIPEGHRAGKRNQIGALGWAYMYLGAKNQRRLTNYCERVGWKRYLLSWSLQPFLGLIDFLSSLTVYRHYQLNLIMTSILFQKSCNYESRFHALTLRVLKELRGVDDAFTDLLTHFNDVEKKPEVLAARLAKVKEEQRARKAEGREELGVWTPGFDSPGFARHNPHNLYVMWVESLVNQAREERNEAYGH